jgi:hypothetical protein
MIVSRRRLSPSHLLSVLLFFFAVAVGSVGLRRQIAFISDDQIENCADDGCGEFDNTHRRFRDTDPFSLECSGISFFSKAAVHKDGRVVRKVRFYNGHRIRHR